MSTNLTSLASLFKVGTIASTKANPEEKKKATARELFEGKRVVFLGGITKEQATAFANDNVPVSLGTLGTLSHENMDAAACAICGYIHGKRESKIRVMLASFWAIVDAKGNVVKAFALSDSCRNRWVRAQGLLASIINPDAYEKHYGVKIVQPAKK
jgi:hypothetical protein